MIVIAIQQHLQIHAPIVEDPHDNRRAAITSGDTAPLMDLHSRSQPLIDQRVLLFGLAYPPRIDDSCVELTEAVEHHSANPSNARPHCRSPAITAWQARS
ncbi:hypothetical protein ARC78_15270 [Stenotrophomonas pictorum JCM 9942]|uniref:Uncharacterized protein n=1 Tax=Stenotrophomonas pictorum JCM 9942 TaxID=1236960 RepID=A0A0R0A8I6_9GAMM|nr:hypothetical protein ARC78_15270 [Stenotrophomonas pictorum JCM 9942]